jgi:hypothetical protein
MLDWKAGEQMQVLSDVHDEDNRLLSWAEMAEKDGLVHQLVRKGFEHKDKEG